MNYRAVYFTAPGKVEIREAPLLPLKPGEILVKTLFSGISSGTEKLIYQGFFPQDLPLDDQFPGLREKFNYPVKYGYAAVGKVIEMGPEVEETWLERMIFSFQPHQTYFTARIQDIHPIPPEIKVEDGVFLPNMETALNLVMDGAPLIGENIAVFGQGIIGLLTTALLSRFPLSGLITLDPLAHHRQVSLHLGATHSLDPDSPEVLETLNHLPGGGIDLTFELSGTPDALNLAIQATGFGGRILVGSWYGQKRASLNLGGRFHRNRIRLISSQVSSIAPELSGRWDKARRFNLTWEMIRRIQPGQLITHRLPIDQAAQAYQLLTEAPDETLQVIFTYE